MCRKSNFKHLDRLIEYDMSYKSLIKGTRIKLMGDTYRQAREVVEIKFRLLLKINNLICLFITLMNYREAKVADTDEHAEKANDVIKNCAFSKSKLV